MRGWMIFLLAVVLYGMSVGGEFIQDDMKVIQADPEMGKVSALVASWARPYYYYDEGKTGIYRPLTSFSFYLNSLITGRGAWGFHLLNVFIYGWVCFSIYKELCKYLKEPKAFWMAVIFAVLPIHCEVVNNIVGRAEMLSMMFVLLAMSSLNKKKWEISALWYFLALTSKETAIVGFPILAYLLWTSKEKIDVKAGVTTFYVLVTICYLLIRTTVLGSGGMENSATMVENPLKFVSTEQRIQNAFALVPFGLEKIVFPWHLSYDYSFNQLKLVNNWFEWRVILGITMMLGSLVSLFTKLRKNKLWIMGQAFFWGPIFITGNFIFPIGTIFGERLWFWPSLGVIMTLSILINPAVHTDLKNQTLFRPARKPSIFCSRKFLDIPRNRAFRLCAIFSKSAKYFGFVLIIMFTVRTVVRNTNWLSQERLFVHDAAYAKDSVMTQSNAAAVYLMKSDLKMGKKYMERADMIYPKYPELLNNWGMFYLWMGDKKTAGVKFRECLDERPGYYLCQRNIESLK